MPPHPILRPCATAHRRPGRRRVVVAVRSPKRRLGPQKTPCSFRCSQGMRRRVRRAIRTRP